MTHLPGEITSMKNYLKYGAIALTVIILSVVFGFYQSGVFGARPSGISVVKCQTATTTPAYMAVATASSTCDIDITHTKGLDLNIFFNSTTTPPTMYFVIQTTNDSNPATRNWFNYKYASVATTTRYTQDWTTGPLYNTLTFSSSTLTHKIPLENIRGEQMRITYWVVAAAANIYIEVARDND